MFCINNYMKKGNSKDRDHNSFFLRKDKTQLSCDEMK